MPFQSEFDNAMVEADQVIMDVFAVEYLLTLADTSLLPLKAIFDTKLATQKPTGKSAFKHMSHGILTIHNARLDKALLVDAELDTELGRRLVADVTYPEKNTTVLILSALKTATKINANHGF